MTQTLGREGRDLGSDANVLARFDLALTDHPILGGDDVRVAQV